MKALTNYLHKREAAIHAILKKPRRKYSSKTFHKLRVELKKLNAILKLISFCAQDLNREKTFKPFKKVFRKAGKVREIQVEEKMLKKYLPKNSLKRYRKRLKKRRSKAQKIYFKLVNKK